MAAEPLSCEEGKELAYCFFFQLRDNSIGQEGILDLASAVQTNKIVIDLNVKLNQPGLQGEIKLFELQKVPSANFYPSCCERKT